SKLLYRDAGWLQGFNGRVYAFRDITDCSFANNELIIAVGMWASGQLAYLRSISNVKLQYIHGATPWKPDLMEKALPLPFPKVVVASFLKPLVESYGGGDVLAVIHNGIDQNEYFDSVDESERNGIGTIYSSHPAKDPKTILTVIERLSCLRPDIPIRIFGTDRRPKKIKRNSYWCLPSVEKSREIYSRSLIWILGSKAEGFPAPVLEAMACGCAVVATDCKGTRDMIADGENAFLVDVGSVEQIVSRVLLLLNDETLRKQIRLKAKEFVKEFTLEKATNELESVLEKLALSQCVSYRKVDYPLNSISSQI
ncbi:MAG: glycosyltransferase family 4 protein, partial [Thermodesulfobacteriota bacterium]